MSGQQPPEGSASLKIGFALPSPLDPLPPASGSPVIFDSGDLLKKLVFAHGGQSAELIGADDKPSDWDRLLRTLEAIEVTDMKVDDANNLGCAYAFLALAES